MSTIVLATGNKGKVREFQQRLADSPLTIVPQNEFQVPEADETGLTFVENALIKARNAASVSGHPAIADDSGIAVDALQGQPGIYSARFSGEGATDERNNAKLLEMLADVPEQQRGAQFHCVLVFLRHAEDPTPLICHGRWQGRIVSQASGSNGFGYDPIFWLPELNCTAADLSPEQKNQISHRGQAMSQLIPQLMAYAQR